LKQLFIAITINNQSIGDTPVLEMTLTKRFSNTKNDDVALAVKQRRH